MLKIRMLLYVKSQILQKVVILALMLCFLKVEAKAQSTTTIDSILQRIESLQVRKDDFFYKGTFPSYRRYGRGIKLKEDNNIFFTGLIAFTLNELRPHLNDRQQRKCDSIILRTREAYPYFQNKNGRPTYNFWRVEPPLVFPNSWFLNHFNETQALPDDLDDTSILWLTFLNDSVRNGQNPPDSVLFLIKKLMGEHANGVDNWSRNTYQRYRKLFAYSTWFGVKMPIDFDFCVLCNVLYFVHAYKLPLNVHDSASIELLRRMITDSTYLENPAYISPHYGRVPLELYHISRLLAQFSIPALDTLKPELIKSAQTEYGLADSWLDRVLLSTSQIRLGGDPIDVDPPDSVDLYATGKTFFVASFSDILSDFWKKLLLHSQLIKYYFICPAYRETLYLENVVLRKTIFDSKRLRGL